LLGAEISYASQNIQNFEYEADSKNISTRYKNFLTLFIAWLVVKQFEKQLPALSSNQIALEQKIPIRLVNQLVSMLVEAGVFVEVFNETNRTKTFQPAIDINQLNVSILYEKIESFGTEHFLENKNVVLDDFWHKTQSMNAVDRFVSAKTLIKDI
jgi:membrane protein